MPVAARTGRSFPADDELEFSITDETTIGSLSISAVSPIVEGSVGGAPAGSSTVTVTATASGSSVTLARDVPVRVVSGASGDTATAGTDYVALNQAVVFGPSTGTTVVGTGGSAEGDDPAATRTVTLRTVRDSVVEPDETVTVALADVSPADRAYALGSTPPSTVVTIADDDAIEVTAFAAVAPDDDPGTPVDESTLPMDEDGGSRSFSMTLSRAPDSVLRIPVTVTASGGAGLVSSCTVGSTACVHFDAGATTGTLTVTSQADVLITGPQTITAMVPAASLPINVTLASGVGTGDGGPRRRRAPFGHYRERGLFGG